MSSSQKRVKDYWTDGKWNEHLVRADLVARGVPREVMEDILETPIDSDSKDTPRWKHTPNGDFSTSSAWELTRHRHPHTPVFEVIWNTSITTSMSIFVWRLLANRIPVDTKLQWRKISLASKCRCCRIPSVETREHLFLESEVARDVWRRTAEWFPNLPKWNDANANLEARILFWFRRLGRVPKNHVAITIPCLVLWFIWSGRNGYMHQEKKFSAEDVFSRVKQHLQAIYRAGKMEKQQWKGCELNGVFEDLRGRVQPTKQIRLIRWIPPEVSWIKLNVFGQQAHESGEGSIGGIVRDSRSNILGGFMGYVKTVSSTDAELQALCRGLEMAKSFGNKI